MVRLQRQVLPGLALSLDKNIKGMMFVYVSLEFQQVARRAFPVCQPTSPTRKMYYLASMSWLGDYPEGERARSNS